MKLSLAIFLAILAGVAVGMGTAFWRIRQVPWNGQAAESSPRSRIPKAPDLGQPVPKVVVDQEQYEFGTVDYGSEMGHDFTFTNAGQAPLVLTAGPTSCRCTVSKVSGDKLLPGESFKVTVHWKTREMSNDYRQTVQVYTNDPLRPVVKLSIIGEVSVALRADPAELVFSQISQDERASGEVRLLCGRRQELKIRECRFSDQALAKFFQVSWERLPEAELRDRKGVHSGVLLKVTVKPGLPQGAFRQTILLRTNLKSTPSFSVDVQGTVEGDVTVAGEGWNPTLRLVDFGFVNGRIGAQRRLILVAHGPHAKEVEFKLLQKEPELLQVKLGSTTPIGNGAATQTPLIIQIPKGSPPINSLGSDQGKFGEIILGTNLSKTPTVRILARFLIEEE
jgi:hypothetical protein